ncbi:MAG: DUF4402 domain-containing protein [Saprospirales bacterium]|nr:MAG: DUF4402 domain-containing protein [Saprospirales bacterium]
MNNLCSWSTAIGGLAFLLLGLLGPISVSAQNTVSVNVSVEIVEPLTIEKTSDLSFGNILIDSDGGTVSFDADGNIQMTGGLTFLNSGSQPVQASFNISGRPGTGINIELPQEVILIHPDGHEIILDGITPNTDADPTLDADGKIDFLLNGTLHVLQNQESGDYSGTFIVTVNYN